MYIPLVYITHGVAFAAGVACTLWFFYVQYKRSQAEITSLYKETQEGGETDTPS